jgi:SAM-dependent methyltransferase
MYTQTLDQLQQFYNQNASAREHTTAPAWKQIERQHFLTLLHCEQAKTLLEVGAGVGRDGLFFQQNRLQVTCTDLSAEMVAYCRAKGLTAHQLDFMQLSQLNQTFDAVFALNCLLHVASIDLPAILAQILQQLKPNGLFYYGVYGGNRFEGLREQHDQPPRFYSFYTDAEIQKIVGEQFELVEFRHIEIVDTAGYHFQSMIWRCPH